VKPMPVADKPAESRVPWLFVVGAAVVASTLYLLWRSVASPYPPMAHAGAAAESAATIEYASPLVAGSQPGAGQAGTSAALLPLTGPPIIATSSDAGVQGGDANSGEPLDPELTVAQRKAIKRALRIPNQYPRQGPDGRWQIRPAPPEPSQ
jgi:hypothetical protein